MKFFPFAANFNFIPKRTVTAYTKEKSTSVGAFDTAYCTDFPTNPRARLLRGSSAEVTILKRVRLSEAKSPGTEIVARACARLSVRFLPIFRVSTGPGGGGEAAINDSDAARRGAFCAKAKGLAAAA